MRQFRRSNILPGRESRHGGHGADERVEEARAHARPDVLDGDGEPGRGALQGRVGGEGEVRLGHANREPVFKNGKRVPKRQLNNRSTPGLKLPQAMQNLHNKN